MDVLGLFGFLSYGFSVSMRPVSDHEHKGRKQPRSHRGRSRKPLGTSLSSGSSPLDTAGGVFLIISLIIGPSLAGSYFQGWRYPLIVTSSLAACLLILSSFLQKKYNWWLFVLLVWLVIQGLWMWYNAWGQFSRVSVTEIGQLPWRIFELENQPFPALPGSPDRGEAMDRLSSIIPCLGLVFAVRHLVINRPAWCGVIASVIFWTGAAVALLGLIQRSTGAEGIFWLDELTYKNRGLFFGTYRSPGIATCYLNVALALGLSTLLTTLRKGRKRADENAHRTLLRLLFTIAEVIVIICGVISAGSKAGMAFGLMTIFLWAGLNYRSIISAFHRSSELFLGNKRAERNIVIITLVCITLFSLLSLSEIISARWQAAHEHDYSSLTGRSMANRVQMKMIADDEWGAMGFGPGSFYPLFYYFKGDDEALAGTWVYGHNDYLQTLVEWGWLGGAVYMAVIGGGFFLLAREVFFHREYHSKTRFIYLRGYFIAMLFFLLHASVDFPFQIESIAVTFAVMLGVAWSVVDLRRRDIRLRGRSSTAKQTDADQLLDNGNS